MMLHTLNNKLILGTVQMGLPYGINNSTGKIPLQQSFEILEYAFDNGIRMLDSAEAYGNAHEVIGLFHEKFPNKTFEIITKLPSLLNGEIIEKANAYLNELKVNHLHALLFHSHDSFKNNSTNFEALKRLKADKKIKFIGVSVYTNSEIEALLLNPEVDIIQLPFNLLDNSHLRADVLAKAKAKGKIIHTRSALLQGLFFKDINDNNTIISNLKTELMAVFKIAKENHLAIPQLALGYCLQQRLIDNVLMGVDSLKQLKDNLKAANHPLQPRIVNEVNTIKVANANLLNPSLWN